MIPSSQPRICFLQKEKRINMPILLSLLFLSGPAETPGGRERSSVRRVPSADGVQIVYETAGSREPALIFIHGGFADRSFWANQMPAFSAAHRVLTLDLAGHGESGDGRQK